MSNTMCRLHCLKLKWPHLGGRIWSKAYSSTVIKNPHFKHAWAWTRFAERVNWKNKSYPGVVLPLACNQNAPPTIFENSEFF